MFPLENRVHVDFILENHCKRLRMKVSCVTNRHSCVHGCCDWEIIGFLEMFILVGKNTGNQVTEDAKWKIIGHHL